jgi:hypothetical protein
VTGTRIGKKERLEVDPMRIELSLKFISALKVGRIRMAGKACGASIACSLNGSVPRL